MPDPPDREPAYISAGSSIRPRRNLTAAVDMLCDRVRLTAISMVLRTPAIGRPDDPDFLNCVLRAETPLGPRALKYEVLRPIEESLGGRRRSDRYGPRTIDLDLLLYGSRVADEDGLKLPHPDVSRVFVRAGLLELSPGLSLPPAGIEGAPGEPVPELTALLRRRLDR